MVKVGLVVSKCLKCINVNGRRTTDDARRRQKTDCNWSPKGLR